MIRLVNFLLLIEKAINYTKEDIDKGYTPLKVYELCSCIRESFCLSFSIRKNNILYLYFQKEHILIKFNGKELRYVGTDERSQALLLEKALNKAKQNESFEIKKWKKSTPGIYVRKFINDTFFVDFYTSIAKKMSYLILDDYQLFNKENYFSILNKELLDIMDDCFFIILTDSFSKKNFKIIEVLKGLKNIKLLNFSKIKLIENKILYINFRKDQQRTL